MQVRGLQSGQKIKEGRRDLSAVFSAGGAEGAACARPWPCPHRLW